MLAFLLTEFESFIPSDLNTSIHNTLKIARPSIWWSLLIFIFQLVFRGSGGDQLTGWQCFVDTHILQRGSTEALSS